MAFQGSILGVLAGHLIFLHKSRQTVNNSCVLSCIGFLKERWNVTMRKSRGFALIELLVVTTIIALLLAILVPALQRVQKQTQGVVFQNNPKQIGTAAFLYADEYEQFVPCGLAGGSGKSWFQLFMPFLAQNPAGADYRGVDIFRCPSYPDKEQTLDASAKLLKVLLPELENNHWPDWEKINNE